MILDCRNDTENVKLLVLVKLANYPLHLKSFVPVKLKQEGEKTVELIPLKGDYKIINQEYEVAGKKMETTLFRRCWAGRGKILDSD